MAQLNIEEVSEALKAVKDLQKIVDEMKTMPAYRKYIKQKNLASLDSKFKLVDDYLKKGLLK